MKVFNRVERILLLTGLALLAVCAMWYMERLVGSRVALAMFRAIRKTGSTRDQHRDGSRNSKASIDFSLWSEGRIKAYLESLKRITDPPLAVLRIDRLRVEVPVFKGTDDLTLDRGAGWIIGTAEPGTGGNTGISAHRDGFFRTLKDVRVGDSIVIELPDGRRESYVVDDIQVVVPENVEVLNPRVAPSVTLVTCYPFYFIGSAPKRFIVQGSLSSSETPQVSDVSPQAAVQIKAEISS